MTLLMLNHVGQSYLLQFLLIDSYTMSIEDQERNCIRNHQRTFLKFLISNAWETTQRLEFWSSTGRLRSNGIIKDFRKGINEGESVELVVN